MFQDCSSSVVSFPSCWKKEKLNTDMTTQTSEILTYENSTQSSGYCNVAVQTEEVVVKEHYKLVVDNSAELKEFLQKVEPMVTAALKRNTQSHAFDRYRAEWEEETTEINIIHTLQYLPYKEYHCTGLSWNCTGSVIATCYGKFDHDNWCSHKSALCTWNIDRRSLDPMKPDVIAEVPTCLMSLSFHPSLPSVIAVGGFTGELRILNTANEGDPLVASSDLVDMAHKEPIAQLSWLQSSKGYCIISLGNDGKLLLWNWKSSKLEAIQTFGLKSTCIPSNLKISRSDVVAELGGTCMSFSNEDSNVFVVGCENGLLMKCSVDTDTNTEPIVQYVFKPHHGPVYSLSCSPFHRNLFLSCSLDSTARLYSLLETTPLLTLEPGQGYLFAVKWSPTRPLIVALSTSQGDVLIYDLKFSHITPKVSLHVCEKKPVYCIEPMILATGDANGTVRVYRLSSELTQQNNREIEQLASFVKDLSFSNQ